MFTKSDLQSETIDGQRYTTFQPNTIVYAVPSGSPLDIKIKQAKIGIVWHTSYSGKSLQDMRASFGVNIKPLTKPSSVWMDDASYQDISGQATFTKTETDSITRILSSVGLQFRRISSAQLNTFLAMQNSFTGKMIGASFKTYNNSKVREGQKVTNPKSHAQGYVKWVENKFQTEIDKLKTEKSKSALELKMKETVKVISSQVSLIENVTAFQSMIIDAKMIIINKLNTVKSIGTFVKTDNGFKVTTPEGYVAIDRIEGNAVKLVDRMEFSYNNFTAIKAWDK
jgi:hypothetical protein